MMIQNLVIGAICALAATQFGLQTGLSARWQAVVIFVGSVIVSSFFTSFITSLVQKRKAKQLGCQEPFVRSDGSIGGIGMIKRMGRADAINEVPEEFLRIHREQQGRNTWKQSFFGVAQLFTVEPKNVQALLATQFDDFEIGRLRRSVFFPLLGNGIFTSDGKSWEHSRALLRPQFVRDQVADLNLEELHVQNMFQHLTAGAHGWTPEVNLGPLFFRLTLDSATEFLFGESVESQIGALESSLKEASLKRRGNAEWDLMANSFDSAMHHLGVRGRYGEAYWIHSPKSFHSDCKEVHRFADYYVNRALNLDLSKIDEEKQQNGEKAKYVFLNELVKATRDPIEIRSQLLNILLAGRDTTAGLLGWTFWLLARHPEIFDKLRKAVVEQFGTYQDPQNITFATLKSCSYLQHTMMEVLRLYPSVSLNARRSTRDTTLPLGGGLDGKSRLFVPKGTEVVYSVHVMQRRFDLFGPDADDFKPERWINRKGGWEYLPFNGGPRICLGQQFALTEAGYVIVRMLQKYDRLENLDTVNVPKHQYSVTTAPLAVKVRLHEAN